MTLAVVLGIPAAIVATLTAIGLIWRGYHTWKRAIEEEAIARAKAQQVVDEAQKTIAQKDTELATKTVALTESQAEKRRLTRVADDQRTIIKQLSSALEAWGAGKVAAE